jgi:hypothetical protein
LRYSGSVYPNVAKAGGLQSQGVMGEAVVVYVTLGFTTVSHIIHATINAEIVKITTCHHYMSKRNSPLQMRWGILLLLAGLGVFFMIPQKMQEIEKIEHFSSYLPFIRFCFYFMSVLLIGGGAKKIYHHFRRTENTNEADNHK